MSAIEEIDTELAQADWSISGDGKALSKRFVFPDFREAMAFMVMAGMEAEKRNHHPDWYNSWNRVDVRLTTHDKGAITEKDVGLAKYMDKISAGRLKEED
jgi:4a-hydroxytetrahydrobiopterin dehydratase